MIGLFIADEGNPNSDYKFFFMKSEFPHTLIYHITTYVDISLNSNSTRGVSVTTHATANAEFSEESFPIQALRKRWLRFIFHIKPLLPIDTNRDGNRFLVVPSSRAQSGNISLSGQETTRTPTDAIPFRLRSRMPCATRTS